MPEHLQAARDHSDAHVEYQGTEEYIFTRESLERYTRYLIGAERESGARWIEQVGQAHAKSLQPVFRAVAEGFRARGGA